MVASLKTLKHKFGVAVIGLPVRVPAFDFGPPSDNIKHCAPYSERSGEAVEITTTSIELRSSAVIVLNTT